MKECRNAECCRGGAHTLVGRACAECGTPNGVACTLCPACSKRLKQCEHCRADLKGRHKKEESP